MKTLIMALAFTVSMVGSSAYADQHECECSQSCAEECKKGRAENCECKDCKCAETGECKEHKSCHDE